MSATDAIAQEIADLNTATDEINVGVGNLKEQLGDVQTELTATKEALQQSGVDTAILAALTAAVDKVQSTADSFEVIPPVTEPETPGTDPETPGETDPEVPGEVEPTDPEVDPSIPEIPELPEPEAPVDPETPAEPEVPAEPTDPEAPVA